jgi:hypothetical protein
MISHFIFFVRNIQEQKIVVWGGGELKLHYDFSTKVSAQKNINAYFGRHFTFSKHLASFCSFSPYPDIIGKNELFSA